MSFGLRFENGILVGFNMPEHDVHKKQFAERELKQKLTKQQLRYADHALEFRARWLLESVGYGDSSCNIKEGDRVAACSSIPIGCETPEVVARAMATLKRMIDIDDRHREYVYVLNLIYLERINNETILQALSRFGFSEKLYRLARERFAYFLIN